MGSSTVIGPEKLRKYLERGWGGVKFTRYLKD